MEQHPVPQNITTYQFRLVGDMTLKQFLELASGVVTAYLVFNSSWNLLLRWTLGPILAFFGFALAFLPIEDRPLDQWIINFFRSIYAPTQYLWRQKPKKLDFFAPSKGLPRVPVDTGTLRGHPEKLAEYLKTLPQTPETSFEQAEKKYLQHIASLFGALGLPPSSPAEPSHPGQPQTPVKPGLKGVRVRKLLHPQMCLLPHASLYQAPAEPKTAAMPVYPDRNVGAPTPIPPPPATTKPPTASTAAAPAKPAKPVKKLPAKNPPRSRQKPDRGSTATTTVGSGPAPQPQPTTTPAFAKDVILPQTPEKPNLLAGVTLDSLGKIIPSVILEIKDNQGHPVRALKSNKLGQFFIATPLPDGIYHIEADHPDHAFAIIKLEAKGEIVPPLKIQAQ